MNTNETLTDKNSETIKPSDQRKPERKPKRYIRIFLIYFSVVLSLSMLIYFLVCSMTYSEGTRMGVLYKISKKGYVFKTYEGEIHIGGMYQKDGNIMPPTIFKFSIKRKNKKVYETLDSLQGKRVIVKYRQVIKNFFWQGESDYFVYEGKKEAEEK